jgi:biopolymer transport protein ExbD
MAAKAAQRRFIDVWIVESNTVYREVPFTVVTDWVQQGRLLEDDKIKASGTADWSRVGASADFAPYLPRPDPTRADDQAEALEAVGLDVGWRRPRGVDEEDDPDMIPLIDVSLVLLVFFMMTSSTAGGGSIPIPVPATETGSVASNPQAIWLGVNLTGSGADRTPVYSFGEGTNSPRAENAGLVSQQELLARLQPVLTSRPGRSEVIIYANPDVQSGEVRKLMLALQKDPFRSKVTQKFYGVSDKAPTGGGGGGANLGDLGKMSLPH